MKTKFIADQVLLQIEDDEDRDMSVFASMEIVVVRSADNAIVETIPASPGGNGNKTIIADRNTAADCFTVEGQHTYHAAVADAGGDTHTVGLKYLNILAVPGV